MKIKELFEIQRKLDQRIEQEHPREPGEDRLPKKILALLVELGELANEARFFKFWSHDQKPRRVIYDICKYCEGRKTLEFQNETCWYCNGTGLQVIKKPLLEEYVDGLHFLLSIGLEEGIGVLDEIEISKSDNLTFQFLELFDAISNLPYYFGEYPYIFGLYLGLGEMLGFTWEEIEEAYRQKNRENFRRQDEGY